MNANPHSPHEAPHSILHTLARFALVALLIGCSTAAAPVGASSPSPVFYVEATGQTLSDPFLDYWLEHDGEGSLGLPVTEVVTLDGRPVQYFQYGALVEQANGDLTRLRAGSLLLDSIQGDPAFIGGRRSPSARVNRPDSHADLVHQTNQTGFERSIEVDLELIPYWEQWGGHDGMGLPITPAYRHDGRLTQWFEFARIEVGPDGAELAAVGLELARSSQVPTTPADRGALPLFDPERFATFSGDGTVPNAVEPFDPVRLLIPRIQVDAEIEVTTVEDGVMTNPVDPWKAGWYQSFSRPGEWTNTVIAGHRDWWGYGPVVFWNLGYLQPGDKIYLSGADGAGATYEVGAVEVVPRTVDPQTIINDIGYEALTLITCGGAWTGSEYTERIIIRAYRI